MNDCEKKSSYDLLEIKQAFLSAAIADISTYIQLADTKVSIVMGAVVALIAGILTCYDPIVVAIARIKPCSWRGILFLISVVVVFLFMLLVFATGLLTIRAHKVPINYHSKCFLPQSMNEYSFESYKSDVQKMSDTDVIENMVAELYKLNNINRQKSATMKWTIRGFAALLISSAVILVIFICL